MSESVLKFPEPSIESAGTGRGSSSAAPGPLPGTVQWMPAKPPFAELFEHLRSPFPEEEYEWLPQPVERDATKSKCQFCESLGKYPWHKCPAVHVPFIGHAAVTARLNTVDPQWSYRPVASAEDGTPFIREQGDRLVLWIWLKVLDVEKLGVGDVWKADDDDSPEKKLISDAIRNAAMRFGVAVELWRKDPNRPIHYVNASGVELGRGGEERFPAKPPVQTSARAKTHFVAKVANRAAPDGVRFVCRDPQCTFTTLVEKEAQEHAKGSPW